MGDQRVWATSAVDIALAQMRQGAFLGASFAALWRSPYQRLTHILFMVSLSLDPGEFCFDQFPGLAPFPELFT